MTMKQAMEQIGIYGACYKLSIFMTLAIQSFRYAAEPFFFAQMKNADNKGIYARLLKYFSFVTSLIFLGVMLFIPILIKIVGREFRDAEAVVPILLVANLFLGIFIYLSQWYKQTAKTIYGATLICYFSMAVTSYFLGQKFYPVAYDTKRIGLYIGLAIGLYFLSDWVRVALFGGWTLNTYIMNLVFILGYMLVFVYFEKPAMILKFKRN